MTLVRSDAPVRAPPRRSTSLIDDFSRGRPGSSRFGNFFRVTALVVNADSVHEITGEEG